MNSDERELCRFCLKMAQDQNFDITGDITLNMLNVLSIKMDLDVDRKSLMCRNCQDTIDKCFNFKSVCIYSEDCIAEYITEGSKLDLEEVYLKQILRHRSKRIPRGHKICRLCMKITAKYLNSTDELFALTNDKLQKCMPELNLNVVTQPVICDACLVALETFSAFVINCLDVERKINRYCVARGVDKRHIQLYNVLQFIQKECGVSKNMGKLENQSDIKSNCTEGSGIKFINETKKVEFKSEDGNKGCSRKRVNGSSDTGLINRDQAQFPEADKFSQKGNINCETSYNLHTEEKSEIVFLPKMIKGEDVDENRSQLSSAVEIKIEEIEIKSEDADMSDPKDDPKDNTLLQNNRPNKKKHKKKQKINSQIKGRYFCEICSTTFSSKQTLANHKFCIHRVDPEIIYKCSKCSFKTGCRHDIANHRKAHKSIISESKMYKCAECDFKTKYKNNLKWHSLARHQDLKALIKNHMPTHKGNFKVQIYSCGLCPYKTIDKRHMKYHEMTHKDKSEMATYDCFHCSYKAKRKAHLRRHMITHNTLRELIPYQSKCGFVSKDKSKSRDQSSDKGNIATKRRGRPPKNRMLF